MIILLSIWTLQTNGSAQITGIEERRYVDNKNETTTTMGARAAEKAIAEAGITKEDVDFIVFATLSPDYYFPGPVRVWYSKENWVSLRWKSARWTSEISAQDLSMDYL